MTVCNDEDDCPEPTHTVIRLAKRDDELARRLAAEHGMKVRVRFHWFLFLWFFLRLVSLSIDLATFSS
ncbi:hypothetical protein ANCDUO_16804 [Ancylostoma duodenale]|uniref:Uncharacterized protein n=1 Tax=Ancylostoma duodenale TaxID=51022 RepID=A0A0C2C9U5_9BILA|nr:hypothetical protein ANCDUO_16804 [Ancylostoma duodenale]